ncbi:MAG: adenosylmethionine decarboxylase [Chloroflexi bacterium]|nr:adenosylmethionine decarboxylase [Chloroflexota bacterium]
MKSLGRHLMLELWGCQNLNSLDLISRSLREAADACGAVLLELVLHPFSPIGVTGVAVLSKSHMMIHTWPEEDYAAIDVFICQDDTEPAVVIPIFEKFFSPERVEAREIKRGVVGE